MKKISCFAVMALISVAWANEISAAQVNFTVNNLWIILSAFLVFIMHLGFSCLESGLARSKNTVNILFKNVMIIAIGLLSYALAGFNLMYPGDSWSSAGWLGFAGFGLNLPTGDAGLINYADGSYSYYADFIFQAMFAATAATIVSGAVAERIKFYRFMLFSLIFVGVIYPILGSWKWGGGWLDQLGFYDFAGSTLVHAVGGWGALAGVLILGPRIGKYVNGVPQAIRGHNLTLATIGAFLLWFGWFGFNGGSVLSADPGAIAYVIVTTSLAASAGIISSTFTSKVMQKKPDLTMALNGALAGLVSITAGADTIGVFSSIIVGAIGGVLVVISVIIIDNILKLDDPVGAISVHLVCGIWGTLAVGIFSVNPDHTVVIQLIGIAAYALPSFLGAIILFTLLSLNGSLRVSQQEELIGLDIEEHGIEAYPSFQIFTTE